MKKPSAYAMVEVLGAANAVVVVDEMLKCASLEICSRETSCGGHVTVVLGGDVFACRAAVDKVQGGAYCDICAAYVVSGPSDELARIIQQTGLRRR